MENRAYRNPTQNMRRHNKPPRRRKSSAFMKFAVVILLLWTAILTLYTTHIVSNATEETANEETTSVFASTPDSENMYEASNPFAVFSFFKPHLQPEYEAFQLRRPYLSYEDTVWKVNAGLNRPFFTAAEMTSSPIPLLVNPFNRLPYDFTPHALVPIDDAGRTATPETVAAFNKMHQSAANAGFNLVISSAYRTIDRQITLFENAGGLQFEDYHCPTYGAQSIVQLPLRVAPPGFSEHHTGRALDLVCPNGTLLDRNGPTDMGRWVAQNAYRYGFIVRYKPDNIHITGYISEPWHITYVTTQISMAMAHGNYQSLEEFVARNLGVGLSNS